MSKENGVQAPVKPTALEVIEAWGLDYHIGSALQAIYEGVTTKNPDKLEEAAQFLKTRGEKIRTEALREKWRKNKSKVRKAKPTKKETVVAPAQS